MKSAPAWMQDELQSQRRCTSPPLAGGDALLSKQPQTLFYASVSCDHGDQAPRISPDSRADAELLTASIITAGRCPRPRSHGAFGVTCCVQVMCSGWRQESDYWSDDVQVLLIWEVFCWTGCLLPAVVCVQAVSCGSGAFGPFSILVRSFSGPFSPFRCSSLCLEVSCLLP